MRSTRCLLLAGGLLIGIAGESPAQFALSVGNPYYNQGVSVATPGSGYASGYSNYGGYGPGPGYSNNYQGYSTTTYLAGPGVIGGQYGYNSGYSGYAASQPVYRMGPNRPYYGAYGYGNYSNGSIDGYPPFRPAYRSRRFR